VISEGNKSRLLGRRQDESKSKFHSQEMSVITFIPLHLILFHFIRDEKVTASRDTIIQKLLEP
jgi:hypothetical protein